MIGAEAFLAEHGVAIPADGPDSARHARADRRSADDNVLSDRPVSVGRSVSTGRRGFAEPLTCVDSDKRGRAARPSVGDGADGPDLDACREAALRLLDAAPRASGALRTRLLDKGYADGIVDEVIERLTRVQLLDDEAYARSAVRYCAGRMMGRRGTVMELVRKGVSRSMAERVCAEAESNGVFEESAWELGRSVARKTRGLEPQTRKRRFWGAGGRKGHNPETLRAVAAELFT
ncbi:regulatory protein RecX [Bifidobacterium eulemuris]|uniref:Regulatory protein RecX n=1 Tax=Bifidobacterium eulemuris TaxID=1765219 RepID=A0A261G7T4_9BIFI|nr:regulatory protein RecX [Bifidobacterium eulemuris]OZG67474.1 recombination regulator RecX [Bifidobacterium eulemuris]QOL33031.1 RecX family transcriptional regulator [Bifidobacterium eulemuris]